MTEDDPNSALSRLKQFVQDELFVEDELGKKPDITPSVRFLCAEIDALWNECAKLHRRGGWG